MSDLVLARKYRPRSFEQMVGQTHVVQALTHALESGRLHHAYLFTGTRGIGKTTVSRILAKSLNCTGADGQGGVTAHPCGVCQACTEIDADRYIDYIELDAASNRSIEEIRDLIERAAYKPSVGRYKVFMIDEAHQLTKDAFNALLKTLEEPPEYLKFVLATTDPEKMLPTVLSRCLQFNLRPMAPETVREHLQQVLEAEQVQTDAGALRLLSRAARGSMRDALSLTDQAIAYGGGALHEDGVRAMLGSVDRSHATQLVQALAQRDGPAVLAAVQALRGRGLSASGTLEEMAALLQQMAVEQAVPGALDDHDPDTVGARQLAAALAADETQLLYGIVIHGRAELALLTDEYAALTMVLLRFLAFPPAGALAPVRAAPSSAPLAVTPAVARATAPARPAVVAVKPAAPAAVAPAPSLPPATPAAGVAAVRPEPGSTGVPPATTVLAREPAAPAMAVVPAPAPVAPAPPSRPTVPVQAARPVPAATPPTAARPAAAAPSSAEPPPWVDDDLPPPDAYAEGDFASAASPAPGPDPREHTASARPAMAARTARPAPRDDREDMADPVEVPSPSRAPVSAAPAAAPLQVTEMGELWSQTLRPLVAPGGGLVALVRELAMQAELLDVQAVNAVNAEEGAGRRWRLRVERESLRAPALVGKLAAALQAALGEPVQLDVEAGVPQDSISRRDAEAREAAQREAERTIRSDASVQALLAQFPGARIVPGSIKPVSPPVA